MPDYGDPSNARSWDNANIWIQFPDVGGEFAAGPATIEDDFPAEWDHLGLLDGENGFVFSRSETITTTNAWGGITIASKRSDQSDTTTFTAHEVNELSDRLRGIEEDGGVLKMKRRAPERCKLAFELFDQGRAVSERFISSFEVEIAVNGDITYNETTPQSFPFLATIFPDGSANLWDIQRTEAGS